ncbi:MAG: hypothetical protein AAF488_00725, partial [Planctomycetota bacterium]
NEEIVEHYESYVPALAATGSCVYHASSGCALPRELRSSTCNRFVCRGVRELSGQLSHDPKGEAVIVASEGRAVIRHTVWKSE